MALIPTVGRRSWKIRGILIALYLVLILGALTMVYPFSLMISTATTGEADWREFELVPEYWHSDAALFRKYLLDMSGGMDQLAFYFQREEWFQREDLRPEHVRNLLEMDPASLATAAEDWQGFLDEKVPDEMEQLLFIHNEQLTFTPLSLRDRYFRWLSEKYDGDLQRVNDLYEDTATDWKEFGSPQGFGGRWVANPADRRFVDWRAYVRSQPPYAKHLFSLDVEAWEAVRAEFGNLEGLLNQHQQSLSGSEAEKAALYAEWVDARAAAEARGEAFDRPPPLSLLDFDWDVLGKYEWGRTLQSRVLRGKTFPIAYIRLSEEAREAYDDFARRVWPKRPEFRTDIPIAAKQRRFFARFLADPDACKAEWIGPADARQEWLEYLGQERELTEPLPDELLDRMNLSRLARDAYEAWSRGNWDPPPTFQPKAPESIEPRAVFMQFIVTSDECKLDWIRPINIDRMWREYLAGKYETVEAYNRAYAAEADSFQEIKLPLARVAAHRVATQASDLRWEYVTGNFRLVLDFILLHGRAFINTLIFIALAILAALTVNPMAAYALSRFRLKYASHVLVFLLATMAFPAEVVMIPNFLLVKSFPLGAIILAGAAALMFLAFRTLLKLKLSFGWSLLGAAVSAGLAAYFLPPLVAEAVGREDLNVTLMNTFFALVLPGIANGFSIFLLKGFFDSLPPELYEAAMLDGAGEMKMFWQITMPLCKPVLAVIALGAFTMAYGSFMFAFLTCQDPQMWTLMVFLYQFQQESSVPLVMASLVISAIPTLLVFIFCQKIILRGIVIPTFK